MRKGEVLLTSVIVILSGLIIGQLFYSNSIKNNNEEACKVELCNEVGCNSISCREHDIIHANCGK